MLVLEDLEARQSLLVVIKLYHAELLQVAEILTVQMVLHTEHLRLEEWFMEVTALHTEGHQMDVPFMVVMDQYVEHQVQVVTQIAGKYYDISKAYILNGKFYS